MNIKEKHNPKLTGVAQTLLYPLLGRAIVTKYSWSPINDHKACELINSIEFNFDFLSKKMGDIALFFMARAYQFDKVCREYLKKHPNGTIVNLGAGLETAFYRIDNGKVTWIDIDFPEVISLKQQLLPKNDRIHYISQSILDFSWVNEIKKHSDEILFLAGGFFIYFPEEQVKAILTKMAESFPYAELIFDIISTKSIIHANKKLLESKMQDALIQWPLDDAKDLEKWSNKIKVIAQFPYFKNIKFKPNIPIFTRLKLFFYDLADKPCCVRLKFI